MPVILKIDIGPCPWGRKSVPWIASVDLAEKTSFRFGTFRPGNITPFKVGKLDWFNKPNRKDKGGTLSITVQEGSIIGIGRKDPGTSQKIVDYFYVDRTALLCIGDFHDAVTFYQETETTFNMNITLDKPAVGELIAPQITND